MNNIDDALRSAGIESPHKGRRGLQRLLNAFGYSCSGLQEAFRNEDAFRQEVLLAAVLIPLATIQNPAFDLSGVLGTAVLAPGDSIWGYCPQAGALSITADGLEIANP